MDEKITFKTAMDRLLQVAPDACRRVIVWKTAKRIPDCGFVAYKAARALALRSGIEPSLLPPTFEEICGNPGREDEGWSDIRIQDFIRDNSVRS